MALDPDILVDVTNAANAPEAEMLSLMFENAGIPAHAMTNAGVVNPWELGASNPFRIAVRRKDLDAARRVLAEYRANRGRDAAVDWDSVDVGEPDADETVPAHIRADVPEPPDLPATRGPLPTWRHPVRRIGYMLLVPTFGLWGVAALLMELFWSGERPSRVCPYCGGPRAGVASGTQCPGCGWAGNNPLQTDARRFTAPASRHR